MKKTFKLLGSLLLAAVLTFSTLSLTACGGKKSTDISGAQSVADLKGAKIAAQSGTFHEDARLQIEDVQGQNYKDFDTLYVALTSGAIDGYIAEEPTALTVCYKNSNLDYIHLTNNSNGFTATDADTAIAIGCKKGSDWASKINPILSGISQESRKALMEECVKANVQQSFGSSFSVSNEAPSETTGTLKVAMECAYAPFNWMQLDSSNFAVPIASQGLENTYANGYDVQIAKYIANALGLKLEIYAIGWDSLIPGVDSGAYDLIIAGMSPTAERLQKIDFTDIYYSSNLVVIYKKN